MARRNRRSEQEPRRGSAPVVSSQRVEQWRGEDYYVRQVGGGEPSRSYRCPGCDQAFTGNLPHLVTWSEYDSEASDRRHWHSACWKARDRRSAGVQRSRSAPRY